MFDNLTEQQARQYILSIVRVCLLSPLSSKQTT